MCGKNFFKKVKCSGFEVCHEFCDREFPCGHKCNKKCHPIDKCFEIVDEEKRKIIENNNWSPEEREFYIDLKNIDLSCMSKCGK